MKSFCWQAPNIPYTCVPVIVPDARTSFRTYKLDRWQPRGFEKIKDARLSLLIAICGAGKTILLLTTAVHRFVSSGMRQRQLIVAPQSHIGRAFSEKRSVVVPGRRAYKLVLRNSFCEPSSTATIKKLKAFIMTPPRSAAWQKEVARHHEIQEGIAVTTHAALRLAFAGLLEDVKAGIITYAALKNAFRNLTLTVDEAHHVAGVFESLEIGASEDNFDVTGANNLGAICRFIVNLKTADGQPDPTAQLCLATATPFRGDGRPIMSSKVRNLLDGFFHLPLSEYWPYFSVRTISMGYEPYAPGALFGKILAAVKQEPGEFHLVLIPSTGQEWRLSWGDWQPLFEQLKALYPANPNAVIEVVGEDKAETLAKFLKEDKEKTLTNSPEFPDGTHVVIACQMFDEGTDWVNCSRLYNTQCGSSLGHELQKVGRPMRSKPGKDRVQITHYMPMLDIADLATPAGIARCRERYSNHTNQLLIAWEWDDMFNPILFPPLPKRPGSAPSSPKDETARTFLEVFGENEPLVMREIMAAVEKCPFKNRNSVEPIVRAALEKYPPLYEDDLEYCVDRILVRVIRALMGSDVAKGTPIDVDRIRAEGFDRIVYRNDLVKRSLFYGDIQGQNQIDLRKILLAIEDPTVRKCRELKERLYDPNATTRLTKREATRVGQLLRNREKSGPLSSKQMEIRRLYPAQLEGRERSA